MKGEKCTPTPAVTRPYSSSEVGRCQNPCYPLCFLLLLLGSSASVSGRVYAAGDDGRSAGRSALPSGEPSPSPRYPILAHPVRARVRGVVRSRRGADRGVFATARFHGSALPIALLWVAARGIAGYRTKGLFRTAVRLFGLT